MTQIAAILCYILFGLATVQAIFTMMFVSLFFRTKARLSETDQQMPKAAILLPLRGADPELANALRRLFQQDYADYEVQVVIDREEDPAWGVVQEVVEELAINHVHVSSVAERQSTCSPQCSALIQAVNSMHDDVEAVVIIDGDVVVHKNWLHELTSPLTDKRVGVAHGNRWFMPEDSNWGSLVRYLWNAGAVVPMYLFGIPWAGTFVIRKSVLMESGLFEKWQNTVVPDAPSKGLLKKMRLKVRFIPELMMVNHEKCNLRFSHDFLKRQMMWTRIYHPNWLPVFSHALATTLIFTAAIVLAVFALATSDWETAIWAVGGFGGYLAAMISLLVMMEIGVRKTIRQRGEEPSWFSAIGVLKLPFAIPLTQFVYFSAVLLAHFRNQVTWRGVTYLIHGPFDVEVLSDMPIEQSVERADANTSL